MKFFVPINKKSIRKNPNAGKMNYFIYGKPIVTNFIINDNGEIIGKQISQDIQEVFSLTPEPSYLYDFEDIEVECEACGAKFSYKELIEEDNSFYDYSNIVNICPRCNSGFCCEVEFEKLTPEVLKNVHVQ